MEASRLWWVLLIAPPWIRPKLTQVAWQQPPIKPITDWRPKPSTLITREPKCFPHNRYSTTRWEARQHPWPSRRIPLYLHTIFKIWASMQRLMQYQVRTILYQNHSRSYQGLNLCNNNCSLMSTWSRWIQVREPKKVLVGVWSKEWSSYTGG